jgi:type I restriction-modification system DNA methylase subunit
MLLSDATAGSCKLKLRECETKHLFIYASAEYHFRKFSKQIIIPLLNYENKYGRLFD